MLEWIHPALMQMEGTQRVFYVVEIVTLGRALEIV